MNNQTKSLGIVTPIPKGTWDASTIYDILNIVRYNGKAYIAVAQNVDIAPGEGTGWQNYWMELVQDGQFAASTKAYFVYRRYSSNNNTSINSFYVSIQGGQDLTQIKQNYNASIPLFSSASFAISRIPIATGYMNDIMNDTYETCYLFYNRSSGSLQFANSDFSIIKDVDGAVDNVDSVSGFING